MLWNILVQFIFRLTFGLAAAMGVTSSELVTAGYFRVHLWVTLGLSTLAAVALTSGEAGQPAHGVVFQLAVATAIASYVGSVIWLYERQTAGRVALWTVASCGLLSALLSATDAQSTRLADVATSGLFLGFVIAAMFLGHWYLNHPGMQLAPLKRLILGILIVGLLRSAICGWGAWAEISAGTPHQGLWWTLLAIRWIAGLLGTMFLAVLTWQTLKIPNTQSATGILYVAVITVFLGELSSLFLSASSALSL